jgi:O-methyltransferase
MLTSKIPPIRRFFQLQIPQLFRPAVTTALARTIGRVNLEAPATGLTVVAYWTRFSRWCNAHPVPGSPDGSNGNSRHGLYQYVIEREKLDSGPITYLEFGVYRGDSFRLWLSEISHRASNFVGFDTFTGLPERWRPTEPEGHFNANGVIPEIHDSRGSFEVGLFQQTLPRFVRETNLSGRLVVNLDADMFTSTLFVLTTLAPFLKSRDLIFFDEFSCPLDEFRAFDEFVRAFRVKYELIAAVRGYTRACIKIEGFGDISN